MDPTAVRDLAAQVLSGLADDPPLVVLDAAVLNSLDPNADLWAKVGGQVVLTPNEGELTALAGAAGASGAHGGSRPDVRTLALSVADAFGAVVVVRGWIVSPEGECWRHEAGTAGLGTSGSGDVKAGIVAGIGARGAVPPQAGAWGAHVHARAGERLGSRVGVGFLARELLEEIPAAMAEIAS
jgi:NAD(P)H-hydrate repair Nnr-like enzyme with NAD(P)H-hydrate dehydratase domain